ncbi:MAG: J domain-containing protein [Myxococcota bacterium]
MSVTRRLFNVARAELKSAFGRRRPQEEPQHEPEPKAEAPPERPTRRAEQGTEVHRYYANLELPYGAPLDEVKAAYRRLMRSYHPDHHANDPERQRLATELSQQLRVAYEALVAHLSSR